MNATSPASIEIEDCEAAPGNGVIDDLPVGLLLDVSHCGPGQDEPVPDAPDPGADPGEPLLGVVGDPGADPGAAGEPEPGADPEAGDDSVAGAEPEPGADPGVGDDPVPGAEPEPGADPEGGDDPVPGAEPGAIGVAGEEPPGVEPPAGADGEAGATPVGAGFGAAGLPAGTAGAPAGAAGDVGGVLPSPCGTPPLGGEPGYAIAGAPGGAGPFVGVGWATGVVITAVVASVQT